MKIRCTHIEKRLIQLLAQKARMTTTDYIIIHCVHNPHADPILVKLHKKMVKSKIIENYRQEAELNKGEQFMKYIDKNYLKKILSTCKTSLFLTGDINMKEVNSLIDELEYMEKQLTPKVRELKKENLDMIRRMRNKEYLSGCLYKIDSLIDKRSRPHIKKNDTPRRISAILLPT